MKTVVLLFFCLITHGFCSSTCLTIFSFNDAHHFKEKSNFPKIMTLLEQERKLCSNHLTLVNADLKSKKINHHIFNIFNKMGIDFICLNIQKPELLHAVSTSKFNWLAANVINQEDKCLTKGVYTFQQDNIKIGLFGLVYEKSNDQWSFLSPLYVAEEKISELKKMKVDLIVVVSSLTLEEDRKLAKRFPEIGVIIGCHEKKPISWFEDETFIHRSSSTSPDITRIDIQVEKKETPWRTKTKIYPTWKFIANEEVEPHPVIAEMVRKALY